MGLIQSRFIQSPLIYGGGVRKAADAAAASVSFIGVDGSASNLTTYEFADVPIGDADASREVFLAVHWRSSTGGGRTVSSGTIGGVSLRTTHAHSETIGLSTEEGIDLVSAAVPSGTTATISITMNGSCLDLDIGVFRAINVASLTPFDTIQDVYENDPSDVIDIPEDGFVIAAYTASNNVNGWTGVTESYNADGAGNEYVMSAGFAHQLTAESGRAIEVDQASSFIDGTLCAASFA